MRAFNFILPVVAILTIAQLVDANTNVVSTTTSTKPSTRIHVHHMHRASPTSGGGATLVTKGPQTTSMIAEKRDDMPTISESESQSYSYSLAIPNASKTSNSRKDPYIYRSSLPENLVFIVVGAIILFILLCFIGYRITAYILSNKRAKADREVYYNFGYNPGSGAFGSESSNSSMLEKSSLGSVSSLHMLSRHNSLLQLQHETDNITLSNSQQGRSYRNAVSDNKANRGSMFISPVLELMNTKSNSQLELPLYHKNASQTFNNSLASLIRNLEMMDSPVNDFHPNMNHSNASFNDLQLVQTQLQTQHPQSKLKRPPSMVLDNLIN
ncbi:uncharacterized protein AC631_00474 [Debaryomyces fabryi]|uniref:Uncharacterized protein n=1 Tax=Debaryomyces fabryi TaxID=58627 RepID=A0A0V1Q6I7_9ASCO|nr:uncharacterized protein AC631_00474 [Debaryomyces fabryi]KSA03839.1 hypothetical protein AC631_00474 [Debaryomyces fabryi]CUM45359.1 unnamed protein product [Debaryomyces fabryi]